MEDPQVEKLLHQAQAAGLDLSHVGFPKLGAGRCCRVVPSLSEWRS